MNIQNIDLNAIGLNSIDAVAAYTKQVEGGLNGADHINQNSVAFSYAMDCMDGNSRDEFEAHLDILGESGAVFEYENVVAHFLAQ